jgi:hypothetical protein
MMKPGKPNILFTFCFGFLLMASAANLRAQTTAADSADEKMKDLRQISWNIMRLVGGLSNHFSDFKGDSITQVEGGIIGYKVKNLLNMKADNEYIFVKPNGSAYYVAVITGDELRLKLYFLAFNYGIDDFRVDNAENLLAKPDPDLSTNEKDVYALMLKDTKVGTLTREKNNMRARIIIGFLK